MPTRIQRKRTKGWRMSEDVVYVGRPTRWGNPWAVSPTVSAEAAVSFFRKWIEVATIDPTDTGAPRGSMKELVRATLRGKDLACWCPLGHPCHADVLMEIANA